MHRHSAADASRQRRRWALDQCGRILPVCSLLAPGGTGASAPSVRRRVYEMGSSLPQCVGDKPVVAVDDGEVNRLARSQIIQIVCDGKGSRVSRGEALELAQILGPLPHVSRSVGRVY